MTELFSPETQWLWTIVLGLALFWPVRNLIWVLTVRREQRKASGDVDEARRSTLKRRAGFTAALLCFVFSVIYVNYLFATLHGGA